MPNRILRDGILSSEAVAKLSWAEEVFYRRLHSVADDHGRFHALPKLVRAACYPLLIDKVSDSDIGKWIAACATAGLVRVYPASDGKRYLQIVKFGQQVRAKSKFPDPLQTADSTCEQLLANAHLGGGVFGGVVEDDIAPEARGGKPPSDYGFFPDVPETVIRDFRKLRNKLRAPITETAAAGIKREAEKAGITVEAALRICCERGWRGFKAEWVTQSQTSTPTAGTPRKRRELGT